MKEHDDCTRGVCPGASAHGETVQVYVAHTHPLLQLRVSPKSLLCHIPVAERPIDIGRFESLEHKVYSTDP